MQRTREPKSRFRLSTSSDPNRGGRRGEAYLEARARSRRLTPIYPADGARTATKEILSVDRRDTVLVHIMLFLSTLLVPSLNVGRLPSPRTLSRSTGIVLGSGDGEAAAREEELLRKLMTKKVSGMSEDDISASLEGDLEQINQMREGFALPKPLPPRGAEDWGRWSQDEDGITLELYVDSNVVAKDVECAISVGFLDVRIMDEPLLSGRLAQPVVIGELNWALDDDSSLRDQRLLCVDVPKRERAIYGDTEDFFDPLFESLRVRGEEIVGPGLVAGRYLE